MSRKRMVILGIDGMDFDYSTNLIDKLPNIKKLSKTGIVKPFKSVFPPDSIPAWITAYTGKDPSEHGVLESVNYLESGDARLSVDTTSFQGKTFWDVVSEKQKEVCVINPFMAYPVWPVKGVMINGPVFISGDQQVSDLAYVEGLQVPKSFGGIVDFPTKKTLKDFCEQIFKDTEEQFKFGINLLKKRDPDLFFQAFLTMDRIQHFLWRYCDPNDPTHPGRNIYEDTIRKFYIFIDDMIGKYMDCIESDCQLLVISDHGHGMRCTHCFNLNEYLRRQGFLQSSAKGKLSARLVIEKLKNNILLLMNKYNLEDYIQPIGRLIPNAGKLKKGKHITDNSRNIAFTSDFAGTNPWGGIVINKELVKNYEEFRVELILELSHLKYEGQAVFTWLRNREEIYSGRFIDRFPDILFGLDERLGVSWGLHTKLITVNPTHKKISGGHKENGVIFMNRFSEENIREDRLEIINLFPTILDYFEIDNNENNRRSFLK